jgi:Holliday junction resolvase RusA-like endonuclease
MILDIPNTDIVPYVRMTRRGKFVNPRAQKYLSSKNTLSMLIKSEMVEHDYDMMPAKTPLWVNILVQVPSSQGHRADIDNICKAVLDACNGIAYPDDRWIDELEIKRTIGDETYLGLTIEAAHAIGEYLGIEELKAVK